MKFLGAFATNFRPLARTANSSLHLLAVNPVTDQSCFESSGTKDPKETLRLEVVQESPASTEKNELNKHKNARFFVHNTPVRADVGLTDEAELGRLLAKNWSVWYSATLTTLTPMLLLARLSVILEQFFLSVLSAPCDKYTEQGFSTISLSRSVVIVEEL